MSNFVESCDCEPLFPTKYSDYVYNFAYGSNMQPNILTGRRKIRPIESIPGVLQGWQLTFDLCGIPGIEPCFGNIKTNEQSEIHGVLHKMTSQQFKHLLTTEGGGGSDPNGYIPFKVNVHAYDGRIIEAYALIVRQSSPAILNEYTLPSVRYMNLLRTGAAYHQIHPSYIEYLQSLPEIQRNIPVTIFVIIQILIITLLSSPIWIPIVFYYLCTQQKAQARSFYFKLIVTSVSRLHRCFTASTPRQPYYSPPFPRATINLKEYAHTFHAQM